MSGATARTGDGPRTVVVVGGGIAGLAAAWELAAGATGSQRPGGSPGGHPARTVPRVVVLEASARLGGKLRTGTIGGRPVDLGPDAFVTRRTEATELCRELGLGEDLCAPGAAGASVWARGRLRPMPSGLALGVPTRLGPLARSGIVGASGVARAALDLLVPPGVGAVRADDAAVGTLVARRLGRRVADLLADPLIGGITAGPVDTMSAAAVFPPLLAAAGRGGSLMRALRSAAPGPAPAASGSVAPPPVFLRVRGGMGRLADELAAALAARGVEFRTGAPVTGLTADGGRWHVAIGDGRMGGHSARDDGAGDDRAGDNWAGDNWAGDNWAGDDGAGDDGASDDRAGDDRAGDHGEVGAGSGAAAGGFDTIDADAVIVAVPAPAAARLLRDADRHLADGLASVPQASVTVVTLDLPDGALPGPTTGTGFLVPATQGLLITGCTYLSVKWPELRTPGRILLRASCGRAGDRRADAMDDDEIVRRVRQDLGAVIGLGARPVDTAVTRWTEAFPQYRPGHESMVDAMMRAAEAAPAPLALAGSTYHGVGIPACIGTGRSAARRVLERLGATAAR